MVRARPAAATCGRSTSIACTPTSASSCRSSPRRCFAAASRPGAVVYDPFAGSGTTLVEANALGIHAIGADVSAFNCLLMRVKVEPGTTWPRSSATSTGRSPRRRRIRRGRSGSRTGTRRPRFATSRDSAAPSRARPRPRRSRWSPRARPGRPGSRPHHDLDMPRAPVRGPYACHKHRRTCRPVERADHFLRRYATDTARRLAEFDEVRTAADVAVMHADARTVELPERIDGIVTSPPTPASSTTTSSTATPTSCSASTTVASSSSARPRPGRRAGRSTPTATASPRRWPARAARVRHRGRAPRSSSTTVATCTTRSRGGPATRSRAATCGM